MKMANDYGFFNNLPTYDIRNKKLNIDYYIKNSLNKTVKMFKWHGLPETVNCIDMERMLQTAGYIAIAKIPETESDPGLYPFTGAMSGSSNRYYQPSLFTVANPSLKRSYQFKIIWSYGDAGGEFTGSDGACVLIRNDPYFVGLLPIISRYATLLTETDITIYMADILHRTQYAISAGDESTKASAQKFIDDLTGGKLSVIGDNVFIESLKTLPLNASNGQRLTDLIELEQYLRGSLLNEIGLDANYNMKRDRLQSDETRLNKDGLTPLIESMLASRKLACKQLKDVFDLEVTVDLAGAWQHEQLLVDAEIATDLETIESHETVGEGDGDAITAVTDNTPEIENVAETVSTETIETETEKDEKEVN